MNGLSIKLIQSAPILLTFGCLHEGAAQQQNTSVIVTINHYQYCFAGRKERHKEREGKVKRQENHHPDEVPWGYRAMDEFELGKKKEIHLDSMTPSRPA